MKLFTVEIRGLQPILQHSPQALDPTHPLVKRNRELTSKGKKKTEADLEELDWNDFQLALYYNGKYVFVPDTAIVATIRAGAKHNRRGREVQAGVDVMETEVPLIYDGPKDPRSLYDKRYVDRRPAGIQKARVLRVRPRFNAWALAFTLAVDDAVMNPGDAKKALELAGLREGLLDNRPRFGRFEVVSWKEAAS